MTKISELEAYFKSYISHDLINKVMFGGLDDFLDALPSTKSIEYPLLYVPYYTRRLDENQSDMHSENLSFMMAIYEPLPKNKGKEKRSEVLDRLETIIRDCIGRLVHDHESGGMPIRRSIGFKGDGPNVSEPIAPNNLIGWAYGFDIMFESNIHHNTAAWQ